VHTLNTKFNQHPLSSLGDKTSGSTDITSHLCVNFIYFAQKAR